MRVTFVVKDRVVVIDGTTIPNIDMSSLPPDLHAMQWYGDSGELEFVDERGRHVENREITDFSPYQGIVDAALQRKADYEAYMATVNAELERQFLEQQNQPQDQQLR